MTEDGRIYYDPKIDATVFDDGERPMEMVEDLPPNVDNEGRGSAFPIEAEAAAPAPQPAAQAPTPSAAPPAPDPGAETAYLVREAETAYGAAAAAHAEGQQLFQQAAIAAGRVGDRRVKAEREWSVDEPMPDEKARFEIAQGDDTRMATHFASQAQAKLSQARDLAHNGETVALWAAVKSRFPGIDQNSPALGKLASDLWTRRQASRFTVPYSTLVEEHREALATMLGASAPPPPAPAESSQISVEDARTFGLA